MPIFPLLRAFHFRPKQIFAQFQSPVSAKFRHFAQIRFSPLQPCSCFSWISRFRFTLLTRFHPFRQTSDVCPFFFFRSVEERSVRCIQKAGPPHRKDRPRIHSFCCSGCRAPQNASVSIASSCAACSETTFSLMSMGLPPHTLLGALPQTPPGTVSPGNSHGRTASSAPCDFRRSACLFCPLGTAGSGPLDPSSLRAVLSLFP